MDELNEVREYSSFSQNKYKKNSNIVGDECNTCYVLRSVF